jgi:hypothetical protein
MMVVCVCVCVCVCVEREKKREREKLLAVGSLLWGCCIGWGRAQKSHVASMGSLRSWTPPGIQLPPPHSWRVVGMVSRLAGAPPGPLRGPLLLVRLWFWVNWKLGQHGSKASCSSLARWPLARQFIILNLRFSSVKWDIAFRSQGYCENWENQVWKHSTFCPFLFLFAVLSGLC